MTKELYIDLETYSSVDLKTSGVYKYVESPDFEIVLLAYAFDDDEITVVDLMNGEEIPKEFIDALSNPSILKWAHNAAFERLSLKAIGLNTSIDQWRCSMIKAAYCGLPLSLDKLSSILGLGGHGKKATGKALIKWFCTPCRPTKKNDFQFRNLPSQDPKKWADFKIYLIYDVIAEREVVRKLSKYKVPEAEQKLYTLDQEINDRGILIDRDFVKNVIRINDKNTSVILSEIKKITGLENPNSPAQIKEWLSKATGKNVESIAKAEIEKLIDESGVGPVREVLELRQRSSKTSIKKYEAMLACILSTDRAHGLLQFYGAFRTGRWAGRLVQMQNLPQNHLSKIDMVRDHFSKFSYDTIALMYGTISENLSQLIRTAFIAPEGKTFAVADFSAIEARVTAWLAGEQWRLDVFKSHGKIYEASASMMFGVPIEEIDKGSDLRQKGKVAELALGYQGSLGALKKMGGEAMGLSDTEMTTIVSKWRNKSPRITKLWDILNRAAIASVKNRKAITVPMFKNIRFDCNGEVLTIQLPSGRELFYQEPRIVKNKWDQDSVAYRGLDANTKKWVYIPTYGGKLTENIVQAISRDLLANSLMNLEKEGFRTVFHVHDEAVCEVKKYTTEHFSRASLDRVCSIMKKLPDWAIGLPMDVDGYLTEFYKKD